MTDVQVLQHAADLAERQYDFHAASRLRAIARRMEQNKPLSTGLDKAISDELAHPPKDIST